MNPLRRTPDARFLRAVWLSNNWEAVRGNQASEDPLAFSYAKFLYDLNRNMGYVDQDRYLGLNQTFAGVYWLMTSSPDWQASLVQRRDVSAPVFPWNASPETNINVMLQRERSIIKALVLAGATPQFIAQQTQYNIEVIDAFEALCWDIRSRAQSRAWLHNFVFPEGIQASIDPSDFERLLFQRAYAHGLDGVLRFLHLNGHILDREQHAKDGAGYIAADLADRTVAAVQSLVPTQRSAPEIIATTVANDKATKELEIKRGKAEPEKLGTPGSAASRIFDSVAYVTKGFSVANPLISSTPEAEEHVTGRIAPETIEAEFQVLTTPAG